jgi:hypothetical protein
MIFARRRPGTSPLRSEERKNLHTICRVTKSDLSSTHKAFKTHFLASHFFTTTLIRRLTDHTNHAYLPARLKRNVKVSRSTSIYQKPLEIYNAEHEPYSHIQVPFHGRRRDAL